MGPIYTIFSEFIPKKGLAGLLLFLFFFFGVSLTYAQINFSELDNGFSGQSLTAKFVSEDIELKKGEIISNALRIKNTTDKNVNFTVDVTYPDGWKTFHKSTRLYTVSPNDSLFIPVRIIPYVLVKGNTKYFINAYVLSEDGQQISNTYFFAETIKKVRWEMDVYPTEKIYFLNKQNTIDFSVGLLNTGNEQQDILLSLNSQKRNALLLDSSGKIIQHPTFSFSLNSLQDTSFYFKLKRIEEQRNFRRVDIDFHNPTSQFDERRYNLLVNSTQAQKTLNSSFARGRKMTFIKLANDKKVTEYSSDVFPLVATASINNILSDYTTMVIDLRGSKHLENNADLVYATNLAYTTNFLSGNVLRNLPVYLGYFHEKGNIQLGSIGGNSIIPATGNGIRGEYYALPMDQKVGAFFLKNPLFKSKGRTSFGAFHEIILPFHKMRIRTNYGHISNNLAKLNMDAIGVLTGISLLNQHNISLNLNTSRNLNYSNPSNSLVTYGYHTGLSYSSQFLERRLVETVQVQYTSRDYVASNIERFYATNYTNFRINQKWATNLNNNYTRYTNYNSFLNVPYSTFTNQLNFYTQTPFGAFQPGIYYNIFDEYKYRVDSRGLLFVFSRFNMERNFRVSTTFRGGYNKSFDYPDLKNYFVFRFNSLLFYRTTSFSTIYSYGPQSASDLYLLAERGRNPQYVRLSVNHQYLFRNPRFVLQASTSYSYLNVFKQHTFNLFPDLYYYTASGWRFNINFTYSASYRNNEVTIYEANKLPPRQEENGEVVKPKINHAVYLGVGVRKEFGIPVPKAKSAFHTIDFISFYDINGNHVKESNEPVIENVVLQIINKDKYLENIELISNEKGIARLRNMPAGDYLLKVFSLEDLKGWFPYVDDTLGVFKSGIKHIPFVRGTKVYGNVILDREKYGVNSDKSFDLSNIRINANDGKAFNTLTNYDGSFEFYLPYGVYSITMDENILGEKFILVKNNLEVNLDEKIQSLYLSFYIIEKKRRVTLKKFGLDGAITDTSIVKPEDKSPGKPINRLSPKEQDRKDAFISSKTTDVSQVEGLIYTVQLGAFLKPVNPAVFNNLKNLISEKIDNNLVRISAGKMKTIAEANSEKDNLVRVGFKGAFVTAYYNGKNISIQESLQIEESIKMQEKETKEE